ncbi:MAG: DUF5711 family protein [Eubacteriales bacterium]|nr:DUF5711 family protein [Eubacteriales bacterium]
MKFPKKKPNHFKEKQKKDTRKVLSFEELPLEEYEKEQEPVKLKLDKKKILIAVGILVVLVVCVLLFFNRGVLFSCVGNAKGTEFSKAISGSTVEAGNFDTFSKGVAYVSDTSFEYLSRNGEEVYKEQLKFSTPMLKVSESAAIAYDLGGEGFAIFSDDRLMYRGEAEDDIYLADISSDFSYALVTDVNGFNAKLSVYSPNHQLRYTYSFSDFYITSFALNDKATEAVVCGATAENGSEKSAVYVIDFRKEEPKSVKNVTEDILFDCEYLGSNSVCAIGSRGVYFLKGKDAGKYHSKSFDKMTLTAYDFNCDIGEVALSLSRSGDGRNCNVIFVNSSAEVESVIETNLKITSLSSFKNRVALLDTDTLYVYNQNGDELSKEIVATNCKQVLMHSNGAQYVLGVDEIYHLTQ